MFLRVIATCKERTLEGNHNIKTNSQTSEVQPYQFGSLIKVMVTYIHLVLGHALVGPLIQVNEEGDGVFFLTSHCRYAEAVRVKITHVHKERVSLVKGHLVVNESPSSFLIRSRHILRSLSPLHWLDVLTKHHPIGEPPGTINYETGPFSPQWQCICCFDK